MVASHSHTQPFSISNQITITIIRHSNYTLIRSDDSGLCLVDCKIIWEKKKKGLFRLDSPTNTIQMFKPTVDKIGFKTLNDSISKPIDNERNST